MFRPVSRSALTSILLGACSWGNDLHPIRGTAQSSAGAGTQIEPACTSAASDADLDGYTASDGDCNDCNAAVNPGAIDIADNGIDEDCSSDTDDEPASCDDDLDLAGNAEAAAKALGICRTTSPAARGRERSWGLLGARFVYPNGTTTSLAPDASMDCQVQSGAPAPLSHGILSSFGPNVGARQGSSFLVLSSGVARAGTQELDGQGESPAGAFMCTRSLVPDGFPASSYATCGDELVVPPGDAHDPSSAYDGIALELELRAPTNARGISFDFDFYTFEYPQFVCSAFNDAFAALLYSANPSLPSSHNVAFDSEGNPIGVNNGFVEACEPYAYSGMKNGQPFTRSFTCRYGTSELAGTGFDSEVFGGPHAATGWLTTHASIVGGEDFVLRLAIWDAGDEWRDSSVLIDNFKWEVVEDAAVTTRPAPR
jgi:hypothetical protein